MNSSAIKVEGTPRASADRRAFAWLALAIVWIALVRYPLLLNARAHLDSDLAVDGLTLIDVLHGHWRWHYPGTPHMGIVPVIFSLPQAAVWGANVSTLVSGAVALYVLTVVAIFALAWRVYGARAASFSLVPLAFASTGMMWMSARITGMHAMAVLTTAIALLLLAEFAAKGRWWRAALLGLWCGFGVYADSLTLLAALAIAAAFVSAALQQPSEARPTFLGEIARALGTIAIAGAAAWVGYQPHEIGKRVDSYDAYGEQFESIFKIENQHQRNWNAIRKVGEAHAQLLALECLPRLISGHRIPLLQADPAPESFDGRIVKPRRQQPTIVAQAVTVCSLALAAASLVALFVARPARADDDGSDDRARQAVVLALALITLLYPAGFVLNKNIYNSDNFRYLVILIVPLALGSGALLSALAGRGIAGRYLALLGATTFGGLMTLDTLAWYQGLGWVDASGLPVRHDPGLPALGWLDAHPEVDLIYGDYWDIYRLGFLTGGRVRGLPYKNYPDRFGLSSRLPKERPRTILGRPNSMGRFYRQRALNEGGRVIHEEPGFWIIDWP